MELTMVPHAFLREAPLVDGDWIDGYIVELAEWGARLVGKGIGMEESDDNHPMAWYRIITSEDGSEADAAVTLKLWVEQHCGEGVATLAGVKVGKPDCYLDGYRCRICQAAGELAERVGCREALLESIQLAKPHGGDEELFRQRVEHWKDSALCFLSGNIHSAQSN